MSRPPSDNTGSQDALSKLIPEAMAIFARVIENMPQDERPDEASVEFGIALSNDVGAYLAKSKTENTLKITLFWTSEDN